MVGMHVSPGGLWSPSEGVDAVSLYSPSSARYSQRQAPFSSNFPLAEDCLKLFTSRSLAAIAAAIPQSPPQAVEQPDNPFEPQGSRMLSSSVDSFVEPSCAAFAFPYVCRSGYLEAQLQTYEQKSQDAEKEGQWAKYVQHQQQQQLPRRQWQPWQPLQQQLGETQHHLQQQQQEQQQSQTFNYCFDSYPADALTWKGRSGIRSGLTPSRRRRARDSASRPVSGLVARHRNADDAYPNGRSLPAEKDPYYEKSGEPQQQQSQQQQRSSQREQEQQQQLEEERCSYPILQQQQLQQNQGVLQQQQQQHEADEQQPEQQRTPEPQRHEEDGVLAQQQQRVEETKETERQQQQGGGGRNIGGSFVYAEHGSADGSIMSRFEPVHVQRNIAGAAVAPLVSPAGTSVRPGVVDATYRIRGGAPAAAGVPSVQPPSLRLSRSVGGTAKEAEGARAAAATAECRTGVSAASHTGWRGPPLQPSLRLLREFREHQQQQQEQQQQEQQQQEQQQQEQQQKQQQHHLGQQHTQVVETQCVQQLKESRVRPELRDSSSGAVAGRELVPDLNNTRIFQRLLRSFPPSSPPSNSLVSCQRHPQPVPHRASRAAAATGSAAPAPASASSSGADVDAGLHQKSPPVRRYLWHDKRVLQQLGLPLSKGDLFRYAKELEKMYAAECACLRQRRSAACAAASSAATLLRSPPRQQTAAVGSLDSVAMPRWMLDYGVRDPALDEEAVREASGTRSSRRRATVTGPAAARAAAAASAAGEARPPVRGGRSTDRGGRRSEEAQQYNGDAENRVYLYPGVGLSSVGRPAANGCSLAADAEQRGRNHRATAVAAAPGWTKDIPFLPCEALRSGRGAAHLSINSPLAAAKRGYVSPSSLNGTAAAPPRDGYHCHPSRRFCSATHSPSAAACLSTAAGAAMATPSSSRPSPSIPRSSVHFCQGLDTVTAAQGAPTTRCVCSCCSCLASSDPPYCPCRDGRIAAAPASYHSSAAAAAPALPPYSGVHNHGAPLPAEHHMQHSEEIPGDSYLQRPRIASQTSSSSAETSLSAKTSSARRTSTTKEAGLAGASATCLQQRNHGTSSRGFRLSPVTARAAPPSAGAAAQRFLSRQQQLQDLSDRVWRCPRIAALLCSFLPLPQLLQVRRCSKQLLVAAQYEMRYILYATLQQLLQQETMQEEKARSTSRRRRRSSGSSALQAPQDPRQRSLSAGAQTPAFPLPSTWSSSSPGQQLQQKREREQSLPSCPFAADTLIRLLQVKTDTLELLKRGSLPPRRAVDAASPRQQELRAAAEELKRFAAERKHWQRRDQQQQSRRGRRADAETVAAAAYLWEEEEEREVSEVKALEEEVLLRRAMQLQWQQEQRLREQRLQQQEHNLFIREEQLRLQQRLQQQQQQRAGGLRGRLAAGSPATVQGDFSCGWTSAAPWHRELPRTEKAGIASFEEEPFAFRRLRHAFLKLWNYNEEVFKSALYQSAFASFPPYSHDAVAILCRCVFQLCVDSSASISLHSALLLLVDRRSYVWQRMAQLSGYCLYGGGGAAGGGVTAVWGADGSSRGIRSLTPVPSPPQPLQAVPLQQLLAVTSAAPRGIAAAPAVAGPHSRGRSSTAVRATRNSTVRRRQRDSSTPRRWPWRDVDAEAREELINEDEGRKIPAAAVRSFGVRPSVRGSVELKLARLPDEFIDAFLLYGQKQALAHQEACWAASSGGKNFPEGNSSRRGKAYDAGHHVLLDMYEWVAAALTFLTFLDRCVPCWTSSPSAFPAAPAAATKSGDPKRVKQLARTGRTTGTAAGAEKSASKTPHYASCAAPPAPKTPRQSVDRERSAAAIEMMPCNRGRCRALRARPSSASVQQRTASQKSSCSLREASTLCRLLQNQALILEDVKLILKLLAKQV